MSQYSDLIPQARVLLAQLAANNDRDWFADHKSQYETRIKLPGLALGDHIAADLGRLLGQPVTPKLFRVHRDLRFSRDKTPYNAHLHLSWSSEKTGPGWFFGLAPDYVTAGWGWMGFTPAQTARWRKIAAEDTGLARALDLPGYRVSEPELKRVPAPFPKDHGAAENLRRKSLTLWADLDPGAAPDQSALATFKGLLKLHQYLAPQLAQ